MSLLLNQLFIACCQAAFYVSTEKSLWSRSGDNCVPATPRVDKVISYSPNTYIVDSFDLNLQDNEDIWVGYYQTETGFEYIGCVQQSIIFNTYKPKSVKINGDPGHCFPGCGESKIIGVTLTKCYCLGETFNFNGTKTETGCTEKCNHPRVACGHDSTQTSYVYLSIYKIVDKVLNISVTPATSGETNCLNLLPSDSKTFRWDQCTFSHLVMCHYYDRVETVRCDDQNLHCSWIHAANTCFHHQRFPTSYANSKNIDGSHNSQLWTGVFKTSVVYKHNTNVTDVRRHDKKQFGYLTNSTETGVVLNFVETDSMKQYLCVKDDDSATVSPSSSFSTTSQANKSDSDLGDPGVYIAIGVTVLLVLLLVGIVLGVMGKWRKTNSNQQNINHTTIGSHRAVDHEYNYPSITMSGVIQEENIFTINDRAHGHESIADSRINESTTYDRTETCYETIKGEKTYNILSSSRNTTYDKAVGKNMGKADVHKRSSFDKTYDSSKDVTEKILVQSRTDNIYNKTGEAESGDYSHLGTAVTQTKTDNIYGFQSGISRK